MKKKPETRGFSSFGFTTILLSFVMICVVTFSAFSFVTAYSDYNLSQKVAKHSQAYYEATERAYDKLAEIDCFLSDIHQISSNTDENDYYSNVSEVIQEYGQFEHTSSGYYLSFEEPISDEQTLLVTLALYNPNAENEAYSEIVEWKSVYTKDSPPNDYLNLMK